MWRGSPAGTTEVNLGEAYKPEASVAKALFRPQTLFRPRPHAHDLFYRVRVWPPVHLRHHLPSANSSPTQHLTHRSSQITHWNRCTAFPAPRSPDSSQQPTHPLRLDMLSAMLWRGNAVLCCRNPCFLNLMENSFSSSPRSSTILICHL